METSVTIRHADPADYDPIINRVDEWWSGRPMTAMLPRLFFAHFRPWTYVALHQDAIVGFLVGFQSQTDPSLVYCHFIGVDPCFRGQGIGEALYQRLFSEAERHGCLAVLAVTSPANRGSIAFHSRLGFHIMPAEHEQSGTSYTRDYDGPGEDRVRFQKALRETPVGLPLA